MKLVDHISPQPRFSRSINVEQHTTAREIETYIPTGRALDVTRRIARSLIVPGAPKAFSITGPHGSGKSSLATFIDSLLSAGDADTRTVAHNTVADIDPETAELVSAARSAVNATTTGFIRAVVTADREPVIETVARSLHVGATRQFGRSTPVPARWARPHGLDLTPRDIKKALAALCERAPVLLLIDEFGKNLEAYADSGRDGDPYLLQELAEWASGDNGMPLVVITMQHLAFEEYVQETSTARRHEWVKVQGRFEDIAYVETAPQARRLIASAYTRTKSKLDTAIKRWVEREAAGYAAAGLRDLFDGDLVAAAYPIHPTVLAALPDLCSRYGQNERTLFSFLSGPEPLAVPAFLEVAEWTPSKPLPFVRLPQVYDYFVASAATMIGSSATGSRWVEIESRIRDTHGLTDVELAVLKTIGVLNLMSSAGSIRASNAFLHLALTGNRLSTAEVDNAVVQLERLGLVTYREFADEYRIWQGSDFDLKAAVETARRRCLDTPLADLLNESIELEPLVAARHSQQYATLRVFHRQFSDLRPADLEPFGPNSQWDGRILLATGGVLPTHKRSADESPVIVVTSNRVEEIRDLAVDAAALTAALKSAEADDADWVARRELIERVAVAKQKLVDGVAAVFDTGTTWKLHGSRKRIDASGGPSRALSEIADHVYSATPTIPNEMLARRELTSQGAKARRQLIEALLTDVEQPQFGIQGFPPERALYEALFTKASMHTVTDTGDWQLSAPTAGDFAAAWDVISAGLVQAIGNRLNISEIWNELKAPPIGLKDGPIPVLLLAALLIHADEIAVYEHGSLVLSIDGAIAERFVRNPGHFSLKNTAVKSPGRSRTVAKLADRLGITSYSGAPTFLSVARQLFRQMQVLEPYTLATRSISEPTQAMRQAFKQAVEPDDLLFVQLPEVFGLDPIPGTGRIKPDHIDDYVEAVARSVRELQQAYPQLLERSQQVLADAVREDANGLRETLRVLSRPLTDVVLDRRVRAFVIAAGRDDLDDREWFENAAMVVADAAPPRNWTDETVERFKLNSYELGGAFRRLRALIAEQQATGDGNADVLRLTITRPDGSEEPFVVWSDPVTKESLSSVRDEALQAAAAIVGSTAKARQQLLVALLLEDDQQEQSTRTTNTLESERMRLDV